MKKEYTYKNCESMVDIALNGAAYQCNGDSRQLVEDIIDAGVMFDTSHTFDEDGFDQCGLNYYDAIDKWSDKFWKDRNDSNMVERKPCKGEPLKSVCILTVRHNQATTSMYYFHSVGAALEFAERFKNCSWDTREVVLR